MRWHLWYTVILAIVCSISLQIALGHKPTQHDWIFWGAYTLAMVGVCVVSEEVVKILRRRRLRKGKR